MVRPALLLLTWKIRVHEGLKRAFESDVDQQPWHKKPLGVFLLFVFLAVLTYWNIRIPSPGKSVTVLGVAAATMALRGDMKGKEKVAWIGILFGFLLVELTSIDRERTANEEYQTAIRAEQLSNFAAIGDGIKSSIKESKTNFDSTMEASNKIFAGVRTSVCSAPL